MEQESKTKIEEDFKTISCLLYDLRWKALNTNDIRAYSLCKELASTLERAYKDSRDAEISDECRADFESEKETSKKVNNFSTHLKEMYSQREN